MTHLVPLLFLKFFVVPESVDKQSKLLSCNRLFQLSGNRQKESKCFSRTEHELHKRCQIHEPLWQMEKRPGLCLMCCATTLFLLWNT